MRQFNLHPALAAALRGFVAGSALAIWASAWIVTFLELWEGGHLTMGVPIPDRFHSFVAVSADKVLSFFWSSLAVDLPTDPMLFATLLIVTAALTGTVLAALAWYLNLDRQCLGRKSLSWAVRGLFTWQTILLTVVLITLSVTASVFDIWLLGLPILLFVLLSAVLMPFIICRQQVASQPRPGSWRFSEWPGIRRVLWVVGIAVFVIVLDVLQMAVPTLPGIALVLVAIAGLVPHFFAPLLQARVLLSDAPVSFATLRSTLRWSYVGPWIAYHFWIFISVLAVLVPYMVVYVWLWKVVPVIASIAESQGTMLPPFWAALISFFNFIDRYWWLVMPLPLAFLYWLGVARLTHSATDLFAAPSVNGSAA